MTFSFLGSTDEEYKLVVLVRNDINMSKGKIAAQVGHATVECALYSEKKDRKSFNAWMSRGQTKIVLKVSSMNELKEYSSIAMSHGLHTVVITDAGRTQIEPGTITCVGIGPAPANKIDKITGELKML